MEEENKIVGRRDEADYFVYSQVFSTPETEKYIHYLMANFGDDYVTFSSMRMQCTNWTQLLFSNISDSLIGDNNNVQFKGYAYYVSSLKKSKAWQVIFVLNNMIYGFVIFCIIAAIIGATHGILYWKADCVRVSGIICFGLYTWDFYSDIVFSLTLYDCPDCPKLLFQASLAFVVLPWVANMFALSRYQNKWCKDASVRERVYNWFVKWQRLTYALAAISGSAFGTVELANVCVLRLIFQLIHFKLLVSFCFFCFQSYIFGWDFFCMGLHERHLKKFNNGRLYYSILVEVKRNYNTYIFCWHRIFFCFFFTCISCCVFQMSQCNLATRLATCIVIGSGRMTDCCFVF